MAIYSRQVIIIFSFLAGKFRHLFHGLRHCFTEVILVKIDATTALKKTSCNLARVKPKKQIKRLRALPSFIGQKIHLTTENLI